TPIMKYGSIVYPFTIIALSMSLLNTNLLAADTQSQSMTNQTLSTGNKKTAGEIFLQNNKSKAGVTTLPDGLEYKIIKKGNGSHPTINDVVTVHYVGTLIDGTEFDNSYKRGQPATFPVSGVIPGWTEALQLMGTGSIWELYIPASLAYGATGAPPVIGPNDTL